MFSAIGQHAIAELIETSAAETITYDPVSKDTSDFSSLNFKIREDYIQP